METNRRSSDFNMKEIASKAEFNSTISDSRLVVVDFTASWCGPCKLIAPFFESLSNKHPEVVFCKVDCDANQDIVIEHHVSAFPTFKFFIKSKVVDELRGTDQRQLEAKVVQHKTAAGGGAFTGKSAVLGSSNTPAWDGVGNPPSAAEQAKAARDARLRVLDESFAKQAKFLPPSSATAASSQGSVHSPSAAAMADGSTSMEGDDDEAVSEDALMQQALAMSVAASGKADANTSSSSTPPKAPPAAAGAGSAMEDDEDEEGMVPVPVDEGILAELAAMGFSDTVGRKGIVHGKTLEGALEWITVHQDEPDVNQPYLVRKGDADEERAKLNKPPLTEEEKAAKLAELKAKVERRRAQKQEEEKKAQLQREKERREHGQKAIEVAEERQRMLRKREIERAKKEKEDEAKERARLKAEIARDKELRRQHGGVLPSVLGVEGYNPSIVSTASGAGAASGGAAGSSSSAAATPPLPPPPTTTTVTSSSLTAESILVSESSEGITAARLEKIDGLITTIARHRVGGDGGHALKLLNTFVSNVVNNPTEPKFRSINAESNAFKNKLVPLAGTVALLKSVGFLKSTAEEKYIMQEAPLSLLKIVAVKLQQALQAYIQQNGPL